MIETAMSDEDRALHALFNAIQKGRMHMVKAFMKTKVTTNKVANTDGITPVMYAASLGQTEILRFFLDNGCSPHHRSNKGETAVEIAAHAGHQDCVTVLKEYMRKMPAPNESASKTEPAEANAAPRGALMGRILGFLRGHKPETV
ncbi:MAG: hypothetical protein GC149_02790 [Gammaproteobacteria bacterium]|nr:hypothetical protein [Gammaproteobacteria bacterium]